MPSTAALIVAGGTGQRFQSHLPKQYHLLAGKPVLYHTIHAFLTHPRIDWVQCVIHPAHRDYYAAAIADLELPPPLFGGETRQDSVRQGLMGLTSSLLPPQNPDFVLIHDAARPLVDPALIDRVISALNEAEAVIPALPVVDTLKSGKIGGTALKTVPRDALCRAQTPQGFHFQRILELHQRHAGQNYTDDSALCEAAGIHPLLVEGNERNMKITTEADLNQAGQFLRAMEEYRTGSGFDVHRFTALEEGQQGVIVCGVIIPHDHALEGHSDADVGLHALTDAILGAFGAGDIGHHFPPNDPRWRGADSGQFLQHALLLLRQRGGRLIHADLTLICERPKIGPHREAMLVRLADLMEVPRGRISIKATTTEGLGFTGRREGIAAQAIATIAIPQG